MPLRWQSPPEIVFTNLAQAYATAIHQGIKTLAERYSVEIEAWIKSNAPWADRTGNARQTLYSEVTDIANSAVIIIISHGVEYGTFLELAHGGSYAIITPALDHFIPRIWRDVRALVG
jgi:hypothetical protein